MTAEAPEPQEAEEESAAEEPLNREQRRALARGKKASKTTGHQPIASKKGNVRSQMAKGGPAKFQLPTKNG
ncbi:hypothetical protein [Glycomyces rhizosphaerae]|uniref:DUF3043 domain-containing protein n=1 Tax=Glycomyces rhizosphaerae TaxID=2054422 RepID=A0ABV7PTJ4_9ACTN